MSKTLYSNCCNAPLAVISGDEGTSYYQCVQCWKEADQKPPGITENENPGKTATEIPEWKRKFRLKMGELVGWREKEIDLQLEEIFEHELHSVCQSVIEEERHRIYEWLGDGKMDVYLSVPGLQRVTGVDKKGVQYRLMQVNPADAKLKPLSKLRGESRL